MFRCVEKQDASPADMAAWQIANPTYTRDTSNAVLPYYVFTVTSGPSYMETPIATITALNRDLITLISPADLNSFLMNLYATFLNVHGKRFAKPYTPAQLIKATKHIVQCAESLSQSITDTEEMEWTLRVKQIEVKNGAFYLIWSGDGRPLQIQLVEESEQTPDNRNSLEELNVNELPMSDPSTFRLSPPHDDTALDNRAEERKAVEAARVYAQLAHYKAQKAIAKYVKKYGELDNFLSDSSDYSDSDD